MKAIIITSIVLLFFAKQTQSQTLITFTPEHTKIGLLNNSKIYSNIGNYQHFNWGEIKDVNFYAQELKIGLGVSYKYSDNKHLLLGISNTTHHQIKDNNPMIDLNRIYRTGLEFGVMFKFDYIYISILTDFVNKYQTLIAVGIKLN